MLARKYASKVLFSIQRPFHLTMSKFNFSQDEVSRYSRQLLLPEIGVQGQLKLRSTSILIVGCGGLGCPSAMYLAAAGVGKLGLIDHDFVEKSNLHRQVLHNEVRIGQPKTHSAATFLKELNSNVELEEIQEQLTRSNAMEIIKRFDIIVDGTDNAKARYLLSDACVLNKKPLVSGAALRFEGQLTVYNYNKETPCYRCLFPVPPPPGTVTNCSDGGVMGVIPGIIGSLQSLEAIKIAVGRQPSYAGKMLLFDGLEGEFRNIKMRSKKADCVSCGPNATIGPELIDYDEFCNAGSKCQVKMSLKILEPNERVTVQEYNDFTEKNVRHLLIDVRPASEQEIVKLPHAHTIPLKDLQDLPGLKKVMDLIKEQDTEKIFMMCRRGNASQKAVRVLKEALGPDTKVVVKDVIGGITAWATDIDASYPIY